MKRIRENLNFEKLIEEYLEEEKKYIRYLIEYEPTKEVISIDGESLIIT